MVYINNITGQVNINKKIDLRGVNELKGGLEYTIDNKIEISKFIELFNKFNIVTKFNGKNYLKMMNSIINIYKNRNNI